MPPPTRYSAEEVDAILERALARDEGAAGPTHDELRAAAEEVGISREAFEAAAAELAIAKDDRETSTSSGSPPRGARVRAFLRHAVTYAVVTAFLYALNVATTAYRWWIFPALGWGLGVALHGVAVLFPPDPARAEARRSRKDRRREKRRKKHDERFERDVTRAVAQLAAAIERRTGKKLRIAASEDVPLVEGAALLDAGGDVRKKKGS